MERDELGNKTEIDRDYMRLVLNNLRTAIDLELETVHIGYFLEADGLKFYDVQRADWPKLLDLMLSNGVRLEEYELCAEFKELRDQLYGSA